MGVLQDFERRLEGAVEGFFARAFRSGLQPIELAKAIQRYAEDTQHVTADGVVVPNVYRFGLNQRDRERLSTFGDQLGRELADVVTRTAAERRWSLRGPVAVRFDEQDTVRYGMFELAGRVEAVQGRSTQAAPAVATGGGAAPDGAVTVLTGETAGLHIALTGGRITLGRLETCDIHLDDPTVSREHAALVRRGTSWWVVDLGSTNGTTVNGVAAAEQQLSPGDRVELGDAIVEFAASDPRPGQD